MPQKPSVQGERRQLTIVFCDLENWTHYSGSRDVEKALVALEEFRTICTRAIEHFRGYIAEFNGDSMMAYFGFPRAQERSPQAAVNAALEIVRKMAAAYGEATPDNALRVRIGIHTGVVFVGSLTGAPKKDAVVGLAPNLASRIQNIATPNTVVVSEDTFQLIEGQFDTKPLGPQPIRGLDQPMPLHEILGERSVIDQWERVRPDRLRRFIGRGTELSRLREFWQKAQLGRCHPIVVGGPAGIGKSRLIAELTREALASEAGWVCEFQCSPNHIHASFFPVIRAISHRLLGISDDMTLADRLTTVRSRAEAAMPDEPGAAEIVAAFLGIGEPDTLVLNLAPDSRKTRTMEATLRLFAAHESNRCGIYVFSDVHWTDPSTLEWAGRLHQHLPRGLFVFTTREPEHAAQHLPESEIIRLSPLGHDETQALARSVAGGKILPIEVLDRITHSTAGVPLYVEEFTRATLASGSLVEREVHFDLIDGMQNLRVPETLHDLLVARLDHLGEAKTMVGLCAVLGADFSEDAVVDLWEGEHADALRLLEALVTAGILEKDEERDSTTYRFHHILFQNAAYDSLLKTTRAHLHRRIAERLLAREEDTDRGNPMLVAQHFTLADKPAEAARFWLQAAMESLSRSACAEAITYAEYGQRSIRDAGSPADLRPTELGLASTLGTAHMTTQGFAAAEVGKAFSRAEILSKQIGRSTKHFPVLWGLWVYHLMRGELAKAGDDAAELLSLARDSNDDHLIIESLWASGSVAFWRGELVRASELLEEAVCLHRPIHRRNTVNFGQDPGVAARVYLGLALSFRGMGLEAARAAAEAVELAKQLGHPHSMAWALAGSTVAHLVLGDVRGTLDTGTRAISYCIEHQHGFWLCSSTMMVAWAKMQTGDIAEARRMMEGGLASYERIGTTLAQPQFLAIFAECLINDGDFDAAESCVKRGLDLVDHSGELLSKPQLIALDCRLRVRRDPLSAPEAIASLRHACALAHQQSSATQLLQCSATLAFLLNSTGEREHALAVLTPFRPTLESLADNPAVRPILDFLNLLSQHAA